jgi:hypothetical protein
MEFNETIEKIFNKEKALSYSALSAFLKSPRHYYKYVMDKETTEAMEKGKRFHMAILEPEEFAKSYFILDDSEKIKEIGGAKPRGTKDYKDWKAKQLALNEGMEQIDKKEYDTYKDMIKALKQHSVCKDILFGKDGENEKPFEFDDVFKIKGKIDRATPKYTVDLKKVADASYNKIKWDIERMNYDLQAAIYSKANRTNLHYLIYIDEGCNITVVQVGEETLVRYESKFDFAMESFSRCLEEDKWNYSYDFWQPFVRI